MTKEDKANMFQIVLDRTQKEELSKDVYATITDAIAKIRKEEQYTKPYLNKKEISKWLGINIGTLNKFIHNGLPVANIDGTKMIGKETALKFLRDHEEIL